MQCRQTARYNYGVFKSEAKHSVKGAFLSLAQSLLQLSLGPVDFNPLVFKTCLQAGKQPCPCPVEWDLKSTRCGNLFALQAARKVWSFTAPVYSSHLFEGTQRSTAELMGCGSSFFSTMLGSWWRWPELFWLVCKVDWEQKYFLPYSLDNRGNSLQLASACGCCGVKHCPEMPGTGGSG